jgi:hypothetical protein
MPRLAIIILITDKGATIDSFRKKFRDWTVEQQRDLLLCDTGVTQV